MSEIVFFADFPELLKQTVERSINEFAWIIPAWLQRLYVGYHADDKESSAYITVEKDYRFANLKVCGHWVTESAELQREQILHELIHLHNAPMKNAALDVIQTLCEGGDDKIYKIAKRDIVGRNEAATADLAYAISKRFEREK